MHRLQQKLGEIQWKISAHILVGKDSAKGIRAYICLMTTWWLAIKVTGLLHTGYLFSWYHYSTFFLIFLDSGQ